MHLGKESDFNEELGTQRLGNSSNGKSGRGFITADNMSTGGEGQYSHSFSPKILPKYSYGGIKLVDVEKSVQAAKDSMTENKEPDDVSLTGRTAGKRKSRDEGDWIGQNLSPPNPEIRKVKSNSGVVKNLSHVLEG